tara:strand:- start:239 stop:2188 length:1950 start_codon:yes stop_codon:yes gene_type:complete
MLKPEDMSRMTISGHKKQLDSLSNLLDDHQLVHLVDYNNEDEGFKIGTSLSYGSTTSEILVKLRSVIKLLEVSPSPPENLKLSSDIEKEIDELESIASQAHDLKEKQRDCDRKIDDLTNSLEQVEMFSGLDLDMKYLSGYDSMKVFTGRISNEADLSTIDSSLEVIRSDETIIVFCPNDKIDSTERSLLDLGFRSVDAPQIEGDPSSAESKIKSQLSQLQNERDSIDHEIEALAKRHGDWLVSCEEHYSALSEKSSLPLKLATTDNMFVLDGWVPSKSVSVLQQELQKLDVYYELDNEIESSPPIKLDNPGPMKPFEMFTKLYSTPRHWEFEPTAIIFITYPLFFGLMVGDAGYGLAYVLFAQYLIGKFSHSEAIVSLGKILRTAGIYTFLFGTFIYAEAFGKSFFELGELIGFNSYLFAKTYGPSFSVPLIEHYDGAPWHLPIHKFSPYGAQLMLLSSVIIGFIHVSLGLILGFINELKHHDLKHALYAKMSFLLILWGGVMALVSVVGLLPEMVQTLGLVVMLTGLALAIIGEGIVGLLEFPTVFSNVISYARIGAIGLSDYGLAFTVNYISLKMLVPMGPIGIIAAIFIMLIGHLTVFTLGIIGTGINSLRLQYVEFFTKFVQGGGTLYDPFGYDRRYTKENEVQP